ncbi:MAG UNVERIFIED_CONTAM: GntR family transcriptional regulator, partial [Thermobifida fusca]
GNKRPTVRALASDLSGAVNPAARASRELEQAGVVEPRGRSGTFMAAGGDRQRAEALAAARRYAETVSRLGISQQEAVDIVRAAVENLTR